MLNPKEDYDYDDVDIGTGLLEAITAGKQYRCGSRDQYIRQHLPAKDLGARLGRVILSI